MARSDTVKTDRNSYKLFAVCSPGLEPILAQELARLNLSTITPNLAGSET
jgi:23S rRNA G2445 N2-methylase RlmL